MGTTCLFYLGFMQPKQHKEVSTLAFTFQAKELVFDVDLYSGPTVCRLCWRFLAVADKVIDRALRSELQ